MLTTLVARSAHAAHAATRFDPRHIRDVLPHQGPERKALLLTAIDAARAAGAQYCDVRFGINHREIWQQFEGLRYPAPSNMTVVAVSVRALYDGYWGFAAAEGLPSIDIVSKLGKDAAAQAKIGARGKPRTALLAPTAVVTDGVWTTPIEIDPFTVDPGEKVDLMLGIDSFIERQAPGVGGGGMLMFVRDETSFASSDGSFFTQTLYTSEAGVLIGAEPHYQTKLEANRNCSLASVAGAGWEHIVRAPIEEHVPQYVEQALAMRTPTPVNVGRYDIVFDTDAMADILDGTFGAATEIDRAMGYRANTVGTSYLSDPTRMLGSEQVAAPIVSVSSDRTMLKGAATVKWDAEGVTPDVVPLVTKGVLTDFQTTRESASWLSDAYARVNRPVRSHGCATSDSITAPAQSMCANLTLAPGPGNDTFESLVASTKKGLAVLGSSVTMDQQCLNGACQGNLVYEIVDGKLGKVIGGTTILFRAPEFWKGVLALGGPSSARTTGRSNWPLDPLGTRTGGKARSTSVVPAKVKQLAVVDTIPRT